MNYIFGGEKFGGLGKRVYLCGKIMEKTISLEIIKAGMPGLTPIIGNYLYENCLVCLKKAGHEDGVLIQVRGVCEDVFSLQWVDNVSEQMLRSYQDELETTEFGAVCISIVLAKRLTDYTVIERSWHGTGIDYWLGYEDDPLFQRAARLEVSGIKIETASNTVEARYNQKVLQTQLSDQTQLPAFISIVEFGTPKCLFNEKK